MRIVRSTAIVGAVQVQIDSSRPLFLEDSSMPTLNVNGLPRDHQAEPDTPLPLVLREQLGLTGTGYGRGIAQCGACTVHIGVATRSCVRPVGSVSASEKIVTIEGLSASASDPVHKSWAALDVPQCGFCQSGMIMAAALLKSKRSRPNGWSSSCT